MNVIVVGNGASVLKNNLGNFIDNHDIVIRLGGYKINGYEKHIGCKTDIWSNGVSTIKIWKYLENVFNRKLWIVEPQDTCTTDSYISEWQKNKYQKPQYSKQIHTTKLKHLQINNNVEFITNELLHTICTDLNITQYRNDIDFLRPSLGICTVFMAIEKYCHINAIGFDFFQSGWYWDLTHKHCHTKHSSLMERIMFEKLKKTNKITIHD